MMGRDKSRQDNLFYTNFTLDKRVRQDNPLRRVLQMVDFDFIYDEVARLYGTRGNVSVPPPMILKMMFLVVAYNVRSERELMATLPERLDWLWFLGLNLDSPVPHHSVLSKARARWGEDAFRNFFERTVWQCVQAGLVDGSKIFVDASIVNADASNESIIDTHTLKGIVKAGYHKLEERLSEVKEPRGVRSRGRKANNRFVSTTDPDASIIYKSGKRLAYQVHRSVDDQNEVITATETTAGDVNEAHYLSELLDEHHHNCSNKAEVVVADKKYGTKDNYLMCHDRGVKAHIKPMSSTTEKARSKGGRFLPADFTYDEKNDRYTCPAGCYLRKGNFSKQRKTTKYEAKPEDCRGCTLRDRCTDSKNGRSITRSIRQTELDKMLSQSRSSQSRKDIARRMYLMERSFANAKRYGYKHCRYRGLTKAKIQQLLTSAVQNIWIMVRKGCFPTGIAASARMKSLIRSLLGHVTITFTHIKLRLRYQIS